MTFARHVKHASLALWVLSSIGVLQSAYASGTDAGLPINNRATVNYSVGSVAQTPIESSPTGNSTPGVGAGANTTFVVDNKILHTVAETGTNATITTPGALDVVTTFTVTNTGNKAQGYQLTATNLTGGLLFGQTDNTDLPLPLRVFVDGNSNGLYEAGSDTATVIDTLAEDGTVTVFIVANVPVTASNGQYANVQLAATATAAGTGAATPLSQSNGADSPTDGGHRVRRWRRGCPQWHPRGGRPVRDPVREPVGLEDRVGHLRSDQPARATRRPSRAQSFATRSP